MTLTFWISLTSAESDLKNYCQRAGAFEVAVFRDPSASLLLLIKVMKMKIYSKADLKTVRPGTAVDQGSEVEKIFRSRSFARPCWAFVLYSQFISMLLIFPSINSTGRQMIF